MPPRKKPRAVAAVPCRVHASLVDEAIWCMPTVLLSIVFDYAKCTLKWWSGGKPPSDQVYAATEAVHYLRTHASDPLLPLLFNAFHHLYSYKMTAKWRKHTWHNEYVIRHDALWHTPLQERLDRRLSALCTLLPDMTRSEVTQAMDLAMDHVKKFTMDLMTEEDSPWVFDTHSMTVYGPPRKEKLPAPIVCTLYKQIPLADRTITHRSITSLNYHYLYISPALKAAMDRVDGTMPGNSGLCRSFEAYMRDEMLRAAAAFTLYLMSQAQ